jgi:3-methyladenine DNA glycosylase AlkD
LKNAAAPVSTKVREVQKTLEDSADPDDAVFLQRYFKTGPGQYGEGDRFLGIRVPKLRKLAKSHRDLSLDECETLLRSPYHEARLLALLIRVRKCEREAEDTRAAVYRLYLGNTFYVNNWDLVDVSAPRIVGRHLEHGDRSVLLKLARSSSLWERRIAVLATQHFIRNGDFDDTFRIADLLLEDRHDLIHKAVGWMLREVGSRDQAAEEAFLKHRYRRMPRTMLRYAIEKFPVPLRRRYLRGDV